MSIVNKNKSVIASLKDAATSILTKRLIFRSKENRPLCGVGLSLRAARSAAKQSLLSVFAFVLEFILDKKKRQFSLAFYVAMVMIVVFTQTLSTLTVAASQTSATKSSSADWDLGTNAGVTTTGDEIKLTGRSTSWYNNTAPTFYDSAYSYRRKITFDNSAQAENLTDFPVMLKLNNADLSWNAKIQADMDDVIFKDADGTALKWEWETKAPGGESIAWVKIPQIDLSSSTDFIYMDYGNGSATDQSDPANVWTNGYAGVWHMNEASWDGTVDEVRNSKSASLHGRAAGVSNTISDGKVGRAGYIGSRNTPGRVYTAASSSFDQTTFTLESWVYYDGGSNWYPRIAAHGGYDTTTDGWEIYVIGAGTQLGLTNYQGSSAQASNGPTVPVGGWHHVAVSYNDELQKIGLNRQLYDLVRATGGEVFEPDDLKGMINKTKSLSRRTEAKETEMRWPFLLIAMMALLVEIAIRRVIEMR